MSIDSFEELRNKNRLTFGQMRSLDANDFIERTDLPEDAKMEDVIDYAGRLRMPVNDVIKYYDSITTLLEEEDAIGKPEDLIAEDKTQTIGAWDRPISFAEKLFGYTARAKPEHYWKMNHFGRGAFDTYMFGRHLLTRMGGEAVEELGLASKDEINKLYDNELYNNPKWYQKSPEGLGWIAEKAAEYHILKSIFLVTGIHQALTWAGQKAAAPFIAKTITARGGIKTLNVLSKEGLKQIGKDGIASFLRFAPENTAFLSSWAAGNAALKEEDVTEAATVGALWGVGFSAIVPAIGGLGKIALATNSGQKFQTLASKAYTELWIKFPRLMNAGRKPFSDEFLAEMERQYKARLGIDPTAADKALMKKWSRMVGDEITKASQKDAAMKAYWEAGKKPTPKPPPPAVKPTEIAKKALEAPPEAISPIKPPAMPPKPEIAPEAPIVAPKAKSPSISKPAAKRYQEIENKLRKEGLVALTDEEFEEFLTKENLPSDNINRHEAGFVDLTPIKESYDATHDWLWTFGEVSRKHPRLYDKLMKSYAERSAAVEKAISETEKSVVGDIRLSEAENAQISMVYENKELSLPEELSQYKDLLDKGGKLLDRVEKLSIKAGIFKRPFQERMIEEIELQMEKYAARLKHPAVSKKLARMAAEIEALKQMRYLPHTSVARRVLEQRWTTLEGEERKIFTEKMNRISAKFKKRKGKLFLKDYLDEGLITEKDIGFTKLLAEDLSGYYYRSALQNLYDFAKSEGLIKPTSEALRKQGWLNQREIGIISPEIKGQVVHPMLASALDEMKSMRRGRVGMGREAFSMVKIGQFIKPTIVWIYDVVQKYMRGMYSLNPVTEAQMLSRAMRAVINKDSLYHDLNSSNLYQFPYEISAATRNEQIEMFVRKHSSEVNRLISILERSMDTSWTADKMTLRKASRIAATAAHKFVANTLTWEGDKIIRTQSYLILRKMGYAHEEAVKVASRSHAAYSELSPKLKEKLSPLLFVYSFRFLMPIEMAKIITEPMMGAFRATFKDKPPPRYKIERWIKALAATVAMPVLIDAYMRARGFESEGKHLGPLAWKYKKNIVMEDGEEREVVVGLNYILNIPVKYWNRITYYNPIRPEGRHWQAFQRMLKWEIHPVGRIFFWDIRENRRSFGTGLQVYNPEANPLIQLAQTASYMFGQGFRFWGGMMDAVGEGEMTEKEKKEQEKIFNESLNMLDKTLFTVFGYKYIRQPLEDRQAIMARSLEKEFLRRAFNYKRRYEGKELESHLENLEKWAERCRTWIEEGMK